MARGAFPGPSGLRIGQGGAGARVGLAESLPYVSPPSSGDRCRVIKVSTLEDRVTGGRHDDPSVGCAWMYSLLADVTQRQ